MPKILFISPSFYPATYYGGPIYSTYELAKTIKKSGIDVRVITTNANGKEKLKLKTGVFHKLENDLPVKYCKSLDSRGTSLSMLFNLRKEIKKSDLVYLISIFSPPTPLTVILCKIFKKPLIISPHGQLGKWCLDQGNRFKKLWLRLFIHPVAAKLKTKPEPVSAKLKTKPEPVSAKLKTKPEQPVTAKPDLSGEVGSSNFSVHWHLTSAAEEQAVLAVYPSAKSFVIPNGVSSELFSLDDKKKDKSFFNQYTYKASSKKNVIISMGRLQKVKGFDILIEAFDILVNRKPDCLLFIAGEDFGEKSTLQKLITAKNLDEKIFILNHIEGEEKINFLKNADVFALPSHHENFGMVYAEALAAGTPVVASTNTPWKDVEKYNCGRWVENTPSKFAEAIIKILNSDPVQMGINGRKYVGDNFNWGKIGLDFKKQIEKILTENK